MGEVFNDVQTMGGIEREDGEQKLGNGRKSRILSLTISWHNNAVALLWNGDDFTAQRLRIQAGSPMM
jgi:hypothetical protein